MHMPQITPRTVDDVLGMPDLKRQFEYNILRTDPVFAMWADKFVKDQWDPGSVSIGFGVAYMCHYQACVEAKIKVLPISPESRKAIEEELEDATSFVLTALPEFQRAQPACVDKLLAWCSEQPDSNEASIGLLLAHRLFALAPCEQS